MEYLGFWQITRLHFMCSESSFCAMQKKNKFRRKKQYIVSNLGTYVVFKGKDDNNEKAKSSYKNNIVVSFIKISKAWLHVFQKLIRSNENRYLNNQTNGKSSYGQSFIFNDTIMIFKLRYVGLTTVVKKRK